MQCNVTYVREISSTYRSLCRRSYSSFFLPHKLVMEKNYYYINLYIAICTEVTCNCSYAKARQGASKILIILYCTVKALFMEALPSSFCLRSTWGSEKPVKPSFGDFTRLCCSGLQGHYSHEAEAVLSHAKESLTEWTRQNQPRPPSVTRKTIEN